MGLDADTLQRRKSGRREEIVDRVSVVLHDLLDDHPSYLELPLERVLDQAGVSRTTFYRQFDDKFDLLCAVGDTVMTQLGESAMDLWTMPASATRHELEAAVRRGVLAYQPHIPLITAMFEVSTYNRAMRTQLTHAFRELQARVADHLRTGQAHGFVRPELRPDETAGWLTWMAESGIQQLMHNVDEDTADRLIAAMADIFWFTAFDNGTRPNH